MLVACKSRTDTVKKVGVTISVIGNSQEKLLYSNVFDSLRYIALETSDDILITNISKIRYFNNRLFILDKRTQTVFLFDSNGKSIRKIHNVGLGTKEYYQLADFDIDETTGRIFLFSFMDKIQVYDFDGNFIEEYKIRLRGLCFAVYGDLMYIHTGGTENYDRKYNLLVLNKNGVLKGEIPFKMEMKSLQIYNSHEAFCKYGDEMVFFMPFSRDIYAIGRDSTYIKYRFDFGEYNFPDNYFDIHEIQDLGGTKYAYRLNSYWENRKYLSFYITVNQEPMEIIYSKKDGKICNSLYDDMGYCFPTVAQAADDYILGFRSADELHNEYNYSKDKRKNTILHKIISEVAEEDNPVVFFYYFKT
jgi:hypothetical protein